MGIQTGGRVKSTRRGGHAVVVAVIAASLALVSPTQAAAAGTPGCVTRSEYLQVRPGTTRQRVAVVFGTTGRVVNIAPNGFHARSYPICGNQTYGRVSILFARSSASAPWRLFLKGWSNPT